MDNKVANYNHKVVNSDLSEQVFINKKTVGRVAAIERRLVLLVSEIETLALLSVHESLLCWILTCAGYLGHLFTKSEG